MRKMRSRAVRLNPNTRIGGPRRGAGAVLAILGVMFLLGTGAAQKVQAQATFARTYNFPGSLNLACCSSINYGFSPVLNDTSLSGTVQITTITVTATVLVNSPNILGVADFDWEVLMGPSSPGFTPGQVTNGSYPGYITSDAPTQFHPAPNLNASAGQMLTFTNSYDFTTGTLTAPSPEIVYLYGASAPPMDLNNGLYIQVFAWSGGTNVDLTMSNIQVVVTGRVVPLSVLHSFNGADGANPFAGLVMDQHGNLYGTTNYGGVSGDGTAFELVNSNGSYTETLLHSFSRSEGIHPHGALTVDSAGNLYGTAPDGGSGYGTVFELVNSNGSYSLRVLYRFTGTDGANPYAGLIMDSAGNLYGTTVNGGLSGYGNVFELVYSNGSYTETALHNFSNSSGDGANPIEGVVMDSAGNLYGTTQNGGSGYGTVFELVKSNSSYSETVLQRFTGPDGANPYTSLIMDSAGDLYGTALSGGDYGSGTVFELVKSNNSYSENVLYSFKGSEGDGVLPQGGVVMDSSGNLFGMTIAGGGSSGCFYFGSCGTVFELANSHGSYTETLLYSFSNSSSDGATPYERLSIDSAGNLYGPTFYGGAHDNGTVFKLATTQTPQQAIGEMIGYVNNLLTQRAINSGQGNSLTKELQKTIDMSNAGKINGAVGNLESFIGEVNDLSSSGVLSPAQAGALISAANGVIAQLQAM